MSDLWEYWCVEVLAVHGTAEIMRQLALAGSQGWELVAVTPIIASAGNDGFSHASETRLMILTCKRPLNPASAMADKGPSFVDTAGPPAG